MKSGARVGSVASGWTPTCPNLLTAQYGKDKEGNKKKKWRKEEKRKTMGEKKLQGFDRGPMSTSQNEYVPRAIPAASFTQFDSTRKFLGTTLLHDNVFPPFIQNFFYPLGHVDDLKTWDHLVVFLNVAVV